MNPTQRPKPAGDEPDPTRDLGEWPIIVLGLLSFAVGIYLYLRDCK